MCISVLGPEQYCFDSLKSESFIPPFLFFLRFVGQFGVFCVYVQILKKICSALKNAIGNLIEIALNLWRLLWVV